MNTIEQEETRTRLYTPPASGADEVDVLDLLDTLARRKWLLLKVTVACALISTVAAFVIPSWYTATAMILPPQQTQSTANMLMTQLAGNGLGSLASLAGQSMGMTSPNDLYIGILHSRSIQDTLIGQFALQKIYSKEKLSDARRSLQKHSDVASTKEGLIQISVEDRDPKRAAAVANAYVDELRNVTQRLAVTEASRRRIFFEHEVEQARENLAGAEVDLRNTQQKTGVIQIDSQAKAVIEAIGGLRGEIAAAEVMVHAMGSYATEHNPNMVLAQQRLEGLRTQLKKLEQQSPIANDPVLPTSDLPNAGLTYIRGLREVKYRETVFEALVKQFEAAKIDEGKDAAVIQILDRAIEPDKRSFPKRTLLIALATGAGLLSAIFYCFSAAALAGRRRIR
jgi:uncharacterized protein involved in exopolysaccharide biosynthesis